MVHNLKREMRERDEMRPICFKNGPSPTSFSFIFSLFQTNINTSLQQINVKNAHPVYGTGILTHDLQNVSLLP